MTHLTKAGWNVDSHCLGQTRGCDIIASQNKLKLFIEVKGASWGQFSDQKEKAF